MNDGFKMTATMPCKGEEVQLSGDIFFMGKDGLYHLPAGTEAEPLATTNTISPEELAEMNRAPRAYRRRMLKALRKQSKDPQP